MTFQELISKANFNYVNSNITEANFPLKSDGLEEIMTYQFGTTKTTEEVKQAMNEDGYEPARLEHLLQYVIKYPEDLLHYPLVALGSVWDGHAPYVGGDGASRELRLGRLAGAWFSCYAFASVKKGTTELKEKLLDTHPLENRVLLYMGRDKNNNGYVLINDVIALLYERGHDELAREVTERTCKGLDACDKQSSFSMTSLTTGET